MNSTTVSHPGMSTDKEIRLVNRPGPSPRATVILYRFNYYRLKDLYFLLYAKTSLSYGMPENQISKRKTPVSLRFLPLI